MKNANPISMSAIALAAVAVISGQAIAQTTTTIRLTGSTAFRAAVYNALLSDYFDSAPSVSVPSGSASTKSSVITFSGKKSAVFGTNITVKVECAYSGSVEGLANVLQQSAASSVVVSPFWTGSANDSVTDADLALVDVAQDTTPFTSANYTAATEYGDSRYPNKGVGVVTFAFVGNLNPALTLTNITASQFQVLASNGKVSQGYFTGNPSDTNKVYLTGRYSLSGTRLTVEAVTGLGAGSDEVLYAASGDGLTGNNLVIPAGAIVNSSGVTVFDDPNSVPAGGGYIKGGDVATVLANANQAKLLIGYLGLGDVSAAISGKQLRYNGVYPSKTAVTAGNYEFFSYEHLYGRPSPGNGTAAVADVQKFVYGSGTSTNSLDGNGFIAALNVELQGDPNYASLKQMKASRQADGGVISPSF